MCFHLGIHFVFVVRFFVNMWGFERKYVGLLYLSWAPKPLSNTDIEQTVLLFFSNLLILPTLQSHYFMKNKMVMWVCPSKYFHFSSHCVTKPILWLWHSWTPAARFVCDFFRVSCMGYKGTIVWQSDIQEMCLEGVLKALSKRLEISYINKPFLYPYFSHILLKSVRY